MIKILQSIPRKFLILIVALVAVRAALPWICLKSFNWALQNKGKVYTGHLEDFDLSLWRGAYQLQGLEVRKRDSNLPPLLTVGEIDLSIAWRALFQGKFLVDANIDRASVRLIDAQDKSEQQYGVEEDKKTQNEFANLVFPISIERIHLQNSAVYFTNNDFKKALPIALENIQFTINDLRTHQKKALSPFHGTATLQKHAELSAQGAMDVMAAKTRADLNIQLVNFEISTINDILRIYIPIDITQAKLDIYSEAALSNGNGKGYMNVFLNNADVIAGNQKFVSIKHFFFEILGAVGNWLLQNPKDKSLGFHMPFSLTDAGFKLDDSFLLSSALKNRRGDLKKGINQTISLESVESGADKMNKVK